MSSLYYRDKDARRSPVEEFTVLCGRGLWDRPVKARVATARRSKPFLPLLYLVPSSLFLFFACFVLAILLSAGVCFFLLPFTIIVFSWRLFLRLFPASLRPSLMSVFMSLFLFVVFFFLLYVFLHFPFPFLLCSLRSFFLSVSLSSFLFLFGFLSFSLSAFFLYVLLSSFFLSCFLSVFLSWFLSFFLFHAFFLSVFFSFLLSFACLLACLGCEGRNPLARRPTPPRRAPVRLRDPFEVWEQAVPLYVPQKPPKEHPS